MTVSLTSSHHARSCTAPLKNELLADTLHANINLSPVNYVARCIYCTWFWRVQLTIGVYASRVKKFILYLVGCTNSWA